MLQIVQNSLGPGLFLWNRVSNTNGEQSYRHN